jgi:hypothetical protein
VQRGLRAAPAGIHSRASAVLVLLVPAAPASGFGAMHTARVLALVHGEAPQLPGADEQCIWRTVGECILTTPRVSAALAQEHMCQRSTERPPFLHRKTFTVKRRCTGGHSDLRTGKERESEAEFLESTHMRRDDHAGQNTPSCSTHQVIISDRFCAWPTCCPERTVGCWFSGLWRIDAVADQVMKRHQLCNRML